MVIIAWRLDYSRRERCTVRTTFIFWPMVFSGGRIGESQLHGVVNSGVTDQRTQMPRPCHLSYRVCPCTSSTTFFTGQKLPFDLQQGTDFRRLAAKAADVVPKYVSYYGDLEVHVDFTVCRPIYTPPVYLSVHRKFT